MAGWQTVFISWLLVARQRPDNLRFNVKSLHHQSDPHDYREINSGSALILDVHNHARTPAKTGDTNTHSNAYLHSDLQDWQWFGRFSRIYLCRPSECTSQFSSKLKALICHPVQSKFNASNYRGSASRQIWSEEAWQESLLRIRAF